MPGFGERGEGGGGGGTGKACGQAGGRAGGRHLIRCLRAAADFLSPMGSSGVTTAAAFNPCVGEPRCAGLALPALKDLTMPDRLPRGPNSSSSLDAGDYALAFSGLGATIKMPTPVGIEVDLGATLSQLALSVNGSIDPNVYTNLALTSTFWTPRCVCWICAGGGADAAVFTCSSGARMLSVSWIARCALLSY